MSTSESPGNRRRVEFARVTDVVACSLDGTDAATRIGEWQALLRDHLVGREAVPGGIRLRLAPDAAAAALDLAEREAACCGFLDIAVETTPETVVTVTGDAVAAPVIDALVGPAVARRASR